MERLRIRPSTMTTRKEARPVRHQTYPRERLWAESAPNRSPPLLLEGAKQPKPRHRQHLLLLWRRPPRCDACRRGSEGTLRRPNGQPWCCAVRYEQLESMLSKVEHASERRADRSKPSVRRPGVVKTGQPGFPPHSLPWLRENTETARPTWFGEG